MEHTQYTNSQQPNQDGPSEAQLNDAQVLNLYNNGLISRAEADISDIIADFNDGSSGTLAYQTK